MQLRVQRQVVELEIRCLTLSMDYSSGSVATANPICCPALWRNDGSCILFRSANKGRLNLSTKHDTRREILSKIQDIQVTKLWGNDHVYYRNLVVP